MEESEFKQRVGSKRQFARTTVRRSPIDRRSGEDKRKLYSLDYFTEGGEERRRGKERRQSEERRTGWARVYKWCSVFLGKKPPATLDLRNQKRSYL